MQKRRVEENGQDVKPHKTVRAEEEAPILHKCASINNITAGGACSVNTVTINRTSHHNAENKSTKDSTSISPEKMTKSEDIASNRCVENTSMKVSETVPQPEQFTKFIDSLQVELELLSGPYQLSQQQQNHFKDHALHLGFWGFLSRFSIIPVRRLLNIFDVDLPEDPSASDDTLLGLLKHLIDYKFKRKKRQDINTLEHVIALIQNSKNIICLTGAGVSVSCGIPDFRSKNGIYSRLAEFELDDPQQMFDLAYFKIEPRTFYQFAAEIYPSNFKPSPSHLFIKMLESRGKLLRNYTQNIDTLESVAGIERVIQCHGSFKTAKCIVCGYSVDGKAIEEDIFKKQVPMCPKCPEEVDGIMKPDIVFFGEKLPSVFDTTFAQDKEKVDLLIVIGSSLKVSPVADVKAKTVIFIDKIPHHVPQILINMESLAHMSGFDVHLLGDSDIIVQDLCSRLGWDLGLNEKKASKEELNSMYVEPHIYLYKGSMNGVISKSEDDENSSLDEDEEEEDNLVDEEQHT